VITIERRFLPILALGGAVILLHQGLDLFSVIGEADAATPTGRLGLVAVLWTRGPVLLAADVLLVMAAVLSSRSPALVGLGIAHLLLGMAALAEAPYFLVDAASMAGSIAIPELTSFRITRAPDPRRADRHWSGGDGRGGESGPDFGGGGNGSVTTVYVVI